MEFGLYIENFGKIDKADIEIKPLTIIVGENATGKSFITKGLYCILNTLNNNPIEQILRRYVLNLEKETNFVFEYIMKPKRKYEVETYLTIKEKLIPTLEEVIEEVSNRDIIHAEKVIIQKKGYIQELINSVDKYINKKITSKSISKVRKEELTYFKNAVNKISLLFGKTRNIILNEIQNKLEQNLKQNFQVTSLEPLVRKNNTKAILEIDKIGEVHIKINDTVGFSFLEKGIETIGNLKNIIFIDSPVYIKLKRGIDILKYTRKEKELKGYPLYIEELLNFLEILTTEENTREFQEISKKIQKLINGKLEKNQLNQLQFKEENGIEVPISLSAMGISNLSLIEYLVRNNIISKGSFLIMDEPESHLHPQWQVELAWILYDIARAGANIVIATHSVIMAKAFETLLKEEKEATDIIAINKLPYEEEFSKKDIIKKAEEIVDHLSESYSELVWRTL